MISVSGAFKTAIKGNAREFRAYLYDIDADTYIRDDDDLKSIKITSEGDLFKTVLRHAEIKYFGSHDLLGKYVKLGIGVVIAGGSTEYIDYGTFLVVEQETSEGEEHTTLKLYDTMIESLKVYNLDLQDYPLTLKQFLEAICSRLGWTLATSSFFNDDLVVDSDFFILKENMTYRIALEHIAQATSSILYFDQDNELVVKAIGDTSLETVDTEIRTLNLKPEFEVNSVVLANVPGTFVYSGGYYHKRIFLQSGDNLLTQGGEPLRLQALQEIDDIVQIKFENNYLLDDEKDVNVTALGTELIGLKFYPFEASTFGNGYFEIGDRITVVDKGRTNREVLVLSMIIEFDNGLRETLKAGVPIYAYQGTNEDSNTVMDIVLKAQIDGGKNIEDDSITGVKIKSLTADKILTGKLTAVAELGGSDSLAKVIIDGEENRIIVRDEFGVDRILIGRDVGGF